MIRTSLPAALTAAVTTAALPAAAQQGAYDGTYEYAAPGWRGLLEVSTASDATTYFAINTRRNDTGCSLFGEGRLSGNTITLGTPNGNGSLILRFFEDNAEIEASGSTTDFCDAGAQVSGIYIQTSGTVSFDRDDVRTAQTQLNKLGYDAGPVDGILGRRTLAALGAFQQRAGLAQTGTLSLETLYRLDERVGQVTAAATGTGTPAGTGEITPAVTPQPVEITWETDVPRSLIPTFDRLYGADLPARIDWSNPPFEFATLDLDEQPGGGANENEVLVFWNDVNFCGDDGCTFEVLKAQNGTYQPVLQTVAREVGLGIDHDEGMRRLTTDGEPWVWDGDSYVQDVYQPQRVR